MSEFHFDEPKHGHRLPHDPFKGLSNGVGRFDDRRAMQPIAEGVTIPRAGGAGANSGRTKTQHS